MVSNSDRDRSHPLLEILNFDRETRACDLLPPAYWEEELPPKRPSPFEAALAALQATPLRGEEESDRLLRERYLVKRIDSWKGEIDQLFFRCYSNKGELQKLQRYAQRALSEGKIACLKVACEEVEGREVNRSIDGLAITLERIASFSPSGDCGRAPERRGPSLPEALDKVNLFLEDKSAERALAPFIKSLDLEVLSDLVYHLDENRLAAINSIISLEEFNGVKEMALFLSDKIEEWVELNNGIKGKIDALCRARRRDLDGSQLSSKDIEEVKNLAKEIEKMKCVSGKIHWLVKGVVTAKCYDYLIEKELEEEYSLFAMRLDPCQFREARGKEDPSSCFYRYIYEKTLKRCGVECGAKADALFNDWTLLNPDDYRAVGLLGSKECVSGSPMERAAAALEILEIRNVGDWHKNEVYNRKTLEEFLKRPDIQKKIDEGVMD